MKFFSGLILILCTEILPNLGHQWTYTDPAEWAGICKDGTLQSPIDLQYNLAEENSYSKFQFNNYDEYRSAKIKNNGHTVTITLGGPLKPNITGGGLVGTYYLDHMHFHWESEHTINGYRYPMEMHLVHYSAKYGSLAEAMVQPHGLAVLGVVFERSLDDDRDVGILVDVLHKVEKRNTEVDLDTKISPRRFIPRNAGEYFRYAGSLTTPTCNEGVIWTVFTDTLPISADQRVHFESVWSPDGPLTLNYRPVQPLNDREIYYRGNKLERNLMSAGSSRAFSLSLLIIPLFLLKS